MTIYSAALTLILVLDPFGNIPVFLNILSRVDERRRRRIIAREMLIALTVLAIFLFFGNYIMAGLHITQPALGIAGGIMLFLIAIRMIFPMAGGGEQSAEEEPIFVPLAVPLVAGPSSMATVILFAARFPDQSLDLLIALVLAWAFSAAVLLASDFLRRVLGARVIRAVERLMGMILTTMAVQMLLNGIEDFMRL